LGKLNAVLQNTVEDIQAEFVSCYFLVAFSLTFSPTFRQDCNHIVPQLLSTSKSRRRGCPVKAINETWLRDALSHKRRLPKRKIAELLGIDRTTLYRKLKRLNLNQQFTEIPIMDLDTIVSYYKTLQPEAGLCYTMGFLSQHYIKVPCWRVRDSLERVDGLGQALCVHNAII
jgi:hypothetical protein